MTDIENIVFVLCTFPSALVRPSDGIASNDFEPHRTHNLETKTEENESAETERVRAENGILFIVSTRHVGFSPFLLSLCVPSSDLRRTIAAIRAHIL